MSAAGSDSQTQLRDLWTKARQDGCLSPLQQCRVYGLSEAWAEMHGDKVYGKAKWIADRVHVQGQGNKHPSPEAITKLMRKMTMLRNAL